MSKFPHNDPINENEVFKELQQRYDNYLKQIAIYEVIIPVIKAWVGKKITRILRNKIADALLLLGYDRVYYYNEHSYHIDIWFKNEETQKDEKETLYFGTHAILTEDRANQFEEQLKCFIQWKTDLEKLMRNDVISTINDWNTKVLELKVIYNKAHKLHIGSFFNM